MTPHKPRILTAVPQTLEVRLEIMKTIRSLASQAPLQKFDPEQPRVAAGNPDGGQWTSDSGGGSSMSWFRLSEQLFRVDKWSVCLG
jgi:hypothetical protein